MSSHWDGDSAIDVRPCLLPHPRGTVRVVETLITFLLLLGLVCFLLAIPPWIARVNLVAAGLACWILTEILSRLG